VETQAKEFMNNLTTMAKDDRIAKIESLTKLFKEYLKHGEEKVALSIQTYDMVSGFWRGWQICQRSLARLTRTTSDRKVDRHIRRLDDDLAKYEEEQMTGPRISHALTIAREEHRSIKPSDKQTVNTTNNKSTDNKRSSCMCRKRLPIYYYLRFAYMFHIALAAAAAASTVAASASNDTPNKSRSFGF
jgi:hypothetical protein